MWLAIKLTKENCKMSVNFFLVHKAQKAKLNNKNPTQKVKLSTKNDIQHSILRTLSKNKEYIQ